MGITVSSRHSPLLFVMNMQIRRDVTFDKFVHQRKCIAVNIPIVEWLYLNCSEHYALRIFVSSSLRNE